MCGVELVERVSDLSYGVLWGRLSPGWESAGPAQPTRQRQHLLGVAAFQEAVPHPWFHIPLTFIER